VLEVNSEIPAIAPAAPAVAQAALLKKSLRDSSIALPFDICAFLTVNTSLGCDTSAKPLQKDTFTENQYHATTRISNHGQATVSYRKILLGLSLTPDEEARILGIASSTWRRYRAKMA
jgi:hypothetical protein